MATSALEALSAIPLFSGLSTRQLRKLLKGTVEDHYESGTLIVREGGRTETMFVVLEGSARVERDGETISRRGPGEFFGEISMIDGRPRAASVVADTPLRCLVLSQHALRELIRSDPQVAWSLLESLAARLRGE
jgi:CRP/FNR family transcriptional regulator, cyclic AMP receptor protein